MTGPNRRAGWVQGRYRIAHGRIELRSLDSTTSRQVADFDLAVFKGEGLYHVVVHVPAGSAPSPPRPVALAALRDRP